MQIFFFKKKKDDDLDFDEIKDKRLNDKEEFKIRSSMDYIFSFYLIPPA